MRNGMERKGKNMIEIKNERRKKIKGKKKKQGVEFRVEENGRRRIRGENCFAAD